MEECMSYSYDNNIYVSPWNGQKDKIKHVIIENGVMSIGPSAFESCENLLSVSMSNNIVSICDCAFQNCKSLTSIQIPNNVTDIGICAFSNCTNLVSVNIPNSITATPDGMFDGCSALKNIIIPNSVKTIGAGTFMGCSNLETIEIPEGIYIKDHAFCMCMKLVFSVVLSDLQESIGNETFYGCENMSSLFISKSVKTIGERALVGCSCGLEEIIVDKENKVFDSRNNCNALINTETNALILGCRNTIIPNSVTKIGENAFYMHDGITTISIPNSVREIAYGAFIASPIKEITIDVNKGLIINDLSTGSLEKIIMKGKYLPASVGNLSIDYDNVVLSVPAALYEEYCSTLPWSNFKRIEKSVETVNLSDGKAFANYEEKLNCNINYTRTFNNTSWQALYIPFSLNYDDWKDDFEVAYINGIRQFDTDDDGAIDKTIMDVVKIKDGSLIPNTPYLIKAKSVGEKTLSINNATLYETKENSIDCRTTIAEYTFTGTYNAISASTLIANNYYTMGGGALIMTDGNSGLKPYRWYMKIEARSPMYNVSNAAKAITINVVGEEETTTDVEDLRMINYKSPVYDLNGRKVNENNLKPGIYVKNGKKFVVK